MSIKSWDSLKKILKVKILQCQNYVNINDLASRIPLLLWHYNCFFLLKSDFQNSIMRFDNATIALQQHSWMILLWKIFHLWIFSHLRIFLICEFFSSVNFFLFMNFLHRQVIFVHQTSFRHSFVSEMNFHYKKNFFF